MAKFFPKTILLLLMIATIPLNAQNAISTTFIPEIEIDEPVIVYNPIWEQVTERPSDWWDGIVGGLLHISNAPVEANSQTLNPGQSLMIVELDGSLLRSPNFFPTLSSQRNRQLGDYAHYQIGDLILEYYPYSDRPNGEQTGAIVAFPAEPPAQQTRNGASRYVVARMLSDSHETWQRDRDLLLHMLAGFRPATFEELLFIRQNAPQLEPNSGIRLDERSSVGSGISFTVAHPADATVWEESLADFGAFSGTVTGLAMGGIIRMPVELSPVLGGRERDQMRVGVFIANTNSISDMREFARFLSQVSGNVGGAIRFENTVLGEKPSVVATISGHFGSGPTYLVIVRDNTETMYAATVYMSSPNDILRQLAQEIVASATSEN